MNFKFKKDDFIIRVDENNVVILKHSATNVTTIGDRTDDKRINLSVALKKMYQEPAIKTYIAGIEGEAKKKKSKIIKACVGAFCCIAFLLFVEFQVKNSKIAEYKKLYLDLLKSSTERELILTNRIATIEKYLGEKGSSILGLGQADLRNTNNTEADNALMSLPNTQREVVVNMLMQDHGLKDYTYSLSWIVDPVDRDNAYICSGAAEFGQKRNYQIKDVSGDLITKYYYHTAIDIGNEYNRGVKAAARGRIKHIGYSDKGGNFICLESEHEGKKYEFWYFHLCNSMFVEEGQEVMPGQIIAIMGNTGDSVIPRPTSQNPNAGVHLHFEIRCEGQYINPVINSTFKKSVIGGMRI